MTMEIDHEWGGFAGNADDDEQLKLLRNISKTMKRIEKLLIEETSKKRRK
jgi:hypothetical protein